MPPRIIQITLKDKDDTHLNKWVRTDLLVKIEEPEEYLKQMVLEVWETAKKI